VEFLFAPAEISDEVEKEAREIALKVIQSLNMVGILAVEFFLTEDNHLLINEIAPRPHNSGHHTIECCYTSQFEQHLRSIVNSPLGSTKLITPGVMINLLGEPGYEGLAKYENLEKVIAQEGVSVHLYGKQTTKPFRKMGHVTIYGPDLERLKITGRSVAKELKIKA
jgi:5-(carboxyamino)imidazole ribonucleotide synthase